jgi:hypothetical protein
MVFRVGFKNSITEFCIYFSKHHVWLIVLEYSATNFWISSFIVWLVKSMGICGNVGEDFGFRKFRGNFLGIWWNLLDKVAVYNLKYWLYFKSMVWGYESWFLGYFWVDSRRIFHQVLFLEDSCLNQPKQDPLKKDFHPWLTFIGKSHSTLSTQAPT